MIVEKNEKKCQINMIKIHHGVANKFREIKNPSNILNRQLSSKMFVLLMKINSSLTTNHFVLLSLQILKFIKKSLNFFCFYFFISNFFLWAQNQEALKQLRKMPRLWKDNFLFLTKFQVHSTTS